MKNKILQDLFVIFVSVLFAWALVSFNVLDYLLYATREIKFFSSFIAGLFFTSIFTTAPAIAALAEISQASTLVSTAFLGALGAVVGDLVIFGFIRDRLSDHLLVLVQHTKWNRVKMIFRMRLFRWVTFLLGGLIIASPLPDEIGISLLGFSKMKLIFFVPVSFSFNFLGIYLVGLIARAL